ncbi:hypothetical protein C3747_11g56 [Trypanosoma cruzi]|uniref:Uncharacterized protein n=2 Tax=Trypanosoma cruzi TaxID=5693 RepID=Q4DI10_TRYCC|nr:hypothetical protein, conserved [Trypanosoma cruzi]EAN92150.1 hypothetical protein, conserved [Trypanosoma cruzi]KAF8297088.1 hypothetical protein TcYC6_0083750 [Trypanosoma cruzi]PWV18950.1 hypothetical protein C3747_11g56 [Trypanosoma cruzi]RNC59448.1 hypothetical protein TcCL_ESM02895 [Trypanosoma cruzi]|eukprot:XP_814001.1 hypothetical protein [Trypanosoma cruzi strain CL Brener]
MVWWSPWQLMTDDDEVRLQDSEKALSAIFNPSRARLREPRDTEYSFWGIPALRWPFRGGGDSFNSSISFPLPTARMDCKTASVASTVSLVTPAVRKDDGAGASPSKKEAVQEVLDWGLLRPCPILGYKLREEGLVDVLVQPPRTLSVGDLRSLILELSSVEQRAKYVVETQLPQQVHNRGRRGLELFVTPCLFMSGLYLMLWKAPRLYVGVSPRSSVLFTRILFLLRWQMTEVEKERVARNHRWLFQATNARVSLSFLAGLTLAAIAVVTRPTIDVVDVGPDVELGKKSVGFQKHSEAALRWLWIVYYHHPAYKPLAKGTLPPALQNGGARS